jgi:predicted CopG family antitoxin
MVRKLISVSESNYNALKDRGRAGDSFDDVITKLLARGDSHNGGAACSKERHLLEE